MFRVYSVIVVSLLCGLAGCGGTPGGLDPVLFEKYAQGNEKIGQLYFEHVCTDCHKQVLNKPISPSEKTSVEWDTLFEQDKHTNTPGHETDLSTYFSTGFRETSAANNEVVSFLNAQSELSLKLAVYKFIVLGAKDSDMPHNCK